MSSVAVLAVVASVVFLGTATASVAVLVAAKSRANAGADAAALAAAPLTFPSLGGERSPIAEASRLALANAARLVRCRCPVDPSWVARTVDVEVGVVVSVPLFGEIVVRSTASAEFDPVAWRFGGPTGTRAQRGALSTPATWYASSSSRVSLSRRAAARASSLSRCFSRVAFASA